MIRLSEEDVRALREALDSEYYGYARYDKALRDFGALPLLERILDVEAMHIRVLEELHRRYGVPLAKNRTRGRSTRYTDPALACAAAIEAERERVKLYRDLIAHAQQASVVAELRNLERASRNGRLPALKAWARELRRHSHVKPHMDDVST